MVLFVSVIPQDTSQISHSWYSENSQKSIFKAKQIHIQNTKSILKPKQSCRTASTCQSLDPQLYPAARLPFYLFSSFSFSRHFLSVFSFFHKFWSCFFSSIIHHATVQLLWWSFSLPFYSILIFLFFIFIFHSILIIFSVNFY